MRKVIFCLCLSLILPFPVQSFANDNDALISQQIKESLALNEDLQVGYDQARDDAIRIIALIGKKISRERAESIHRKMVFALDDLYFRLEDSRIFLEQADVRRGVNEMKLAEIGVLHRNTDTLYGFLGQLKSGLEDGSLDEKILAGL